jgi:DNA-directed RNA polymerase specialized sigma24 family protein
MIEQTTILTDPLLQPFLEAVSEEQAERALSRLLADLEPVIKNIIGYKLRVYFTDSRKEATDAEDIYSDTILQLLTRLAEIRSNPQAEAIQNVRSYAAVTTYRACYEYLRRKYPQRYSLKNKLRYFLTHQPGFALCEVDGEWQAGLARWQNEKPGGAKSLLDSLRDDPRHFIRDAVPKGKVESASLAELLTAIFNRVEQPLELDELVAIVAEIWNIKDQIQPTDERDAKPLLEQMQGKGIDPASEFDHRAYLAALWQEITAMSPRHCAALLLNLKDEQGCCAIDLFLLTGVATFKEIAAAIDQSETWLAEIWNHLPIDDLRIAEYLGLQRQQVINLRKSARLRLSRRMREIGF